MANVANVRAALDRVERHPDEWNQWTFGCVDVTGRRQACYAGHAAILAGDPPNFAACGPGRLPETIMTISGRFVHDVAQEFLDVTWSQAHRLFRGWNTLDDLRRYVDEIERAELADAS